MDLDNREGSAQDKIYTKAGPSKLNNGKEKATGDVASANIYGPYTAGTQCDK